MRLQFHGASVLEYVIPNSEWVRITQEKPYMLCHHMRAAMHSYSRGCACALSGVSLSVHEPAVYCARQHVVPTQEPGITRGEPCAADFMQVVYRIEALSNRDTDARRRASDTPARHTRMVHLRSIVSACTRWITVYGNGLLHMGEF